MTQQSSIPYQTRKANFASLYRNSLGLWCFGAPEVDTEEDFGDEGGLPCWERSSCSYESDRAKVS